MILIDISENIWSIVHIIKWVIFVICLELQLEIIQRNQHYLEEKIDYLTNTIKELIEEIRRLHK